MNEEERKFGSFEEAQAYFDSIPDKAKTLLVKFAGKYQTFAFYKKNITLEEKEAFDKMHGESAQNTSFIGDKINKIPTEKIREFLMKEYSHVDKGGNLKKDWEKINYTLSKIIIRRFKIFTFSDTGELYTYNQGIYEEGETQIKSFIQQILLEDAKIHRINEIIEHIKRQTYKKREEVEEEKEKICLKNGVLDLNTLKILPHSSKYIFFNKINASYIEGADCPKIKKFLSEIVHKEDVQILQEIAGFCLLKSYFINKAIMLVGSGANGKSTLIILFKEFLGQQNCVSIPLHHLEEDKFALANLHGKLANLFADLPSRALRNTSIFKMLVGEDLIPAEKKFKNKFFFTNYAKQIFSANQVPKSPEDSDAFFRRWVIINFPNQFLNSNAKKGLIKELTTKEELSGFLNFAIEGLKRLLKNQDFSNTESVAKIRDRYIRLSDSVGAFLMDCIQISPESYEEKNKLYTNYCDYCRSNNYPIVSSNFFYKEIPKQIRVEERRISIEQDGKKERKRVWFGIKFDEESFSKNIYLEKKVDKADKVDKINIKENKQPVQPVQDVQVNSQINIKNNEEKPIIDFNEMDTGGILKDKNE